mmetsp:Transcript_898/g.2269  ORF Transcript_898/g.2269 Transcript_898/m.2269 type:complete len:401 (-) Transcript_898:1038-2240(-)|eukprot:CAMPEP_0172375544 /NCGR_PEP_ID=MMETSP1060-20121228/62205_1 /TAXON_ID=37318 /ORGANISM="Pseudo-nitzschia pungens, Strain cf. cingulata" /LENGTH=400 /DNA_ID=CAMNT_0013102709 /DNA_START=313 /DNA_END=1515 /DNA_ORIENTATION=-
MRIPRSPKPNRKVGIPLSQKLINKTVTETTRLVAWETQQVAHEEGPSVCTSTPPPPLLRWIFPALLCALAYALYNVFIKKGSASIHPILGGVVLEIVAALFGSLVLVVLMVYRRPQPSAAGSNHKTIDDDVNGFWSHGFFHLDKTGLWWSIGAGLFVGIGEFLSFVVSGPMGVPVTQSIPIIVGGSVLFGAVLSSVFCNETLEWNHGWLGVGLVFLGICLVAAPSGDDNATTVPLAVWVGLALCCAIAYALYNISIKQASNTIHPIIGGVVLQLVSALFGLVILGGVAIWKMNDDDDEKCETENIDCSTNRILYYDSSGLMWSGIAGLAVGMAELLSFAVSGMGVPATRSIPIVIGGSVALGSIIGILLLGEVLDQRGWVGVCLLVLGIGRVGTDPSSNN